jgi:hypothetical protein
MARYAACLVLEAASWLPKDSGSAIALGYLPSSWSIAFVSPPPPP